MLQQTQVDRVCSKYEQFLERFPTLRALAEASPAEVIRVWAPLGYNRRAINLQRTAIEAVARFGGELPREPQRLRELPGVGVYTSAAVACFAFGQAVAVADTNVRRVLGRIEGQQPESERETLALAGVYLSPERPGHWSQALMDLGAMVCVAAAPRCLICPLRSECRSSGRVVRETRSNYQVGKKQRFEDSDRYLRGRIVDALRLNDSLALGELERLLAIETEEGRSRIGRLIADLERDGLLTRAEDCLRLP